YSYKELKSRLDKLDSKIEALESKKERFIAANRAKKEFSSLSREIDSIKKQYKKACLDAGVKVLEPSKQADILAEFVSDLKSRIRESESINEKYNEQS